ncbi:MAG TPA: VPLPA-CTERM-specific exosortase XrtD, partial [Pararhizobium sp.]|nr:VPLPA-CTERM-specific exosortase XrtD [Pararhizobium sp.]
LKGFAGPLWLLAAMAGAVAAFWIGFSALAKAWSLPEYSHGPLIPILSFFLFLRQLKTVPPSADPADIRWPGFLVTAFALLLATIGNLARIPDIVTYAMIIWIYGILLAGFGWRQGRQFWPPVVHLVFMLPLPAFLYWKLSISLQFISSELGVELIRQFGIPVFLDGNIIDLGVYKLQVAEACSGLRYLFPALSFSYIFAVLYRGPMWHKAVLLLSAAPITIAMNSFRIGAIGVIVDSYGIEHAEGFVHYFEGWVVFTLCVLALFGLARLMQRVGGDRRPLHEALDLDTSGLGAQFMRVLRTPASAALVAAALATAATGAAWHLWPERTAADVSRDPLALFPHELGAWTAGPMQRLAPEIEAVLKADDYFNAAYASPQMAQPVDFFVAYYSDQAGGAGIHSPEVCIPAGGWEMSRITHRTVPVELADGGTLALPVNRAVIQKGLQRQLVYYWFEQRGRHLTSDYVVKAATVLDAVTRGRTDGALVRLVTPLGPREAEAAADARLATFLQEVLPVLPRFVPG